MNILLRNLGKCVRVYRDPSVFLHCVLDRDINRYCRVKITVFDWLNSSCANLLTSCTYKMFIFPQVSQAHVTSMLCKWEGVSRYKQPLRLCMRKKILRSANGIYYHSYLFFYKINKRDLPWMYSCVFWCEFVNLVVFLWLLLFDPCHSLHNRK